MKQTKKLDDEDTMRPEYRFDYSKAVRGKSAARLEREGGAVVVLLQPEVAEVFPDSASVNEALSSLIEIFKKAGAAEARRKKRPADVGMMAVEK